MGPRHSRISPALGLHLAKQAAPPLFVEFGECLQLCNRRRNSGSASQMGRRLRRHRIEAGAAGFCEQPFSGSICPGVFGALDLAVPPLSLLVVLNAVAFLLGIALASAGGLPWPVCVQIAVAFVALIALAWAWRREGRRFASGATLLRLPIYVLWKLPIYLGLVRRGAPKEWLRSGR